jgi:uracil-DNA glycosylase family 4
MSVYDHDCTLCKLHRAATGRVCLPGYGNKKADIMVVGRMPDGKQYREELWEILGEVGLEANDLFWTSALKCRNFDMNASNLDIKMCRTYLEQEIALVKPKWVLTLGNEALFSATGHSGITKYRGRVVEKSIGAHTYKVFPTISYAAVTRNPGQRQAWMADLHLFVSQVFDRTSSIPKMRLVTVDTKPKIKALCKLLDKAELISYDIETRAGDRQEHDPKGVIVSLSGTVVHTVTGDDGAVHDRIVSFAVPLSHPESPWKKSWRSLLAYMAPHFERVPKQIAHNGKFDARWLRKFGIRAKVTFDTMLAAHILDENRQKGLKPQAASRLGVPPWGIDTKDLWLTPLKEVLQYNGLDAYHTYYIYLQLKEELLARPRLARIFQKLLMPSNEELIDAELGGVWVDRQRLASNVEIAKRMVQEIEEQLMEWVPHNPAPNESCVLCKSGEHKRAKNWPTYKSGKPVTVNFNPSIFCKWLLFDHLGLPVLARGKEKQDGSDGDPSMAEAYMLEMRDLHPIIDLLLKRTGWVKNLQFLSSYDQLLDPNDRVHTSFKLFGTRTGRLSSGKEEAEKLTGAKASKGINLQQVPRDVFIRGLFGAGPQSEPEPLGDDHLLVEVDFSQIELRVIAMLAPEPTMKRIYQLGKDIHMQTACWISGLPESQITKELRKKAKPVNFGFAYGMGAPKFVVTALTSYGEVFTLDEAREIRRIYFDQFKGLLPWHARMRRLVHANARVESPIGRIRHLPDIRSETESVRAEAERQAINSPVQSFASDMNLLGMNETMAALRQENYDASILALVHDATLFKVRRDHVAKVLPIIKHQYENLPLKRKFGVTVDVPIVADLKVGTHWGDAKELTEEEVYNWRETG